MRKKAALYGAAVAFTLVASTLALPASNSASAGHVDAARVETTPQAQGSFTLHQLLRSRLDWTLRLTRALRFVDQPPPPPSSFGTMTIIDEPDPAGRKEETDPPSGERPRPVGKGRNPFQDGLNEGPSDLVVPGAG